MRHHRTQTGRRRGRSRAGLWRAGVIAGTVAVGLVFTAAPAWAFHWTTETRVETTRPADPGGVDVYVKIGNGFDGTIYGSARFDAYGERIRFVYRAGTPMTYRIQAPDGVTVGRGFVPPVEPGAWPCTFDWGYGQAGGPCRYSTAGRNIREGTPVVIRICVWLDFHWDWYCGTVVGRA